VRLSALNRWWGVAAFIILILLWGMRPLGIHPPAQIDTPFDTERAISRLSAILGDQRAHPTDSDANDQVEARLLAQIRKSGFTPIVREGFHCNTLREGAAICARPRNILFWVTPPGDNAVMLTSHYDSVPAGPGAADDGIGVAVTLEVAHLLKGKRFARPILVLITDAEEAGLVGASAFAADDPLRARVGAIINMEARGTTGGVNMFQTSRPNGHDIAALIAGGQMASASSLATDFYEIMPNDTDLTMFLPLGVDAANYSVIGGGKRYHTPLDNLSHLDARSVRHMGASTLAATNGFANARATGPESQRVFTDVGRKLTLVMPEWLAALTLVAGLAAALFLFVRSGAEGRVKSIFVPLVALVIGGGGAVAAGLLVGALRTDAAFGTAYPAALRLTYGAAAITGAVIAIYIFREQNRTRLAAASWIWLSIMILAGFYFIPGLSIIVIWPLIGVILAALISLRASWRKLVVPLLFAAAILFVLIVLPLAGGLEEGLFVEQAAISSLLLVFMFLVLMPVGGTARPRCLLGATALTFVIAAIAAMTVPAFTRDAPRHLSVVHEDKDGRGTFLVDDNGPVPAPMQAAARFGDKPDDEGNWRAPAPRLTDDGTIDATVTTGSDGRRSIALRAVSPLADRQEFLIKEGDVIQSVSLGGTVQKIKGVPTYVGCTGRTCRDLDMRLVLAAKGPLPEISWRRTRYGAGAAASRLVAARPDTAQPVHVGDRQVLVRSIILRPAPAGADVK
jgi:hypothetical protein